MHRYVIDCAVLDDILEGVDRLWTHPDIARIVVLYVIYPRLQLLPVHDAPHALPQLAALCFFGRDVR